MDSPSSSQDSKNRRLAAALKRNIARRKAVSDVIPAVATAAAPEPFVFVDDDDDTTSPMGCCGGCR